MKFIKIFVLFLGFIFLMGFVASVPLTGVLKEDSPQELFFPDIDVNFGLENKRYLSILYYLCIENSSCLLTIHAKSRRGLSLEWVAIQNHYFKNFLAHPGYL